MLIAGNVGCGSGQGMKLDPNSGGQTADTGRNDGGGMPDQNDAAFSRTIDSRLPDGRISQLGDSGSTLDQDPEAGRTDVPRCNDLVNTTRTAEALWSGTPGNQSGWGTWRPETGYYVKHSIRLNREAIRGRDAGEVVQPTEHREVMYIGVDGLAENQYVPLGEPIRVEVVWVPESDPGAETRAVFEWVVSDNGSEGPKFNIAIRTICGDTQSIPYYRDASTGTWTDVYPSINGYTVTAQQVVIGDYINVWLHWDASMGPLNAN
jgi:hypothetical protein